MRENPPVGVILCAEKDEAVAHYALEGLGNNVLARECRTVLPSEKLLAREIEKARKELQKAPRGLKRCRFGVRLSNFIAADLIGAISDKWSLRKGMLAASVAFVVSGLLLPIYTLLSGFWISRGKLARN